MKVKEIIKITAQMLGEQEVVEFVSGGAPTNTEQASENANLLLRCYNLITEEIACEYFPLVAQQTFENCKEEKPYFSSFEFTPVRIVCARDKNGQKVPYRLVNNYLEVDCEQVTVEYNYRPKEGDFESEAIFSQTVIGPYTLAFGMASQYCVEVGRISDSEIFNDKYLYNIRGRIAKKGSLKIPPRRWE